jgi:hypothetical protein
LTRAMKEGVEWVVDGVESVTSEVRRRREKKGEQQTRRNEAAGEKGKDCVRLILGSPSNLHSMIDLQPPSSNEIHNFNQSIELRAKCQTINGWMVNIDDVATSFSGHLPPHHHHASLHIMSKAMWC